MQPAHQKIWLLSLICLQSMAVQMASLTKARKPWSVLLLPLPEYSHVQFAAELGIELVKRGHDVHLASTNQYENFAKSRAFSYHDIGIAEIAPLDEDTVENAFEYNDYLINNGYVYRKLISSFVNSCPLPFDVVVVDNEIIESYLQKWMAVNTTIAVIFVYSPYIEDPSYMHVNRGKFDVTHFESLYDSAMACLQAVTVILYKYWKNELYKIGILRRDNGQDLNLLFTIPGLHHPIDFPELRHYVIVGAPLSETPDTAFIPKDEVLRNWMNEIGETDAIVCVSFGSIGYQNTDKLVKILKGIFLASDRIKIVLSHRHPEKLSNHFSIELQTSKLLALKWINQRMILSHPNTKLLVTHSGIHSIAEALSEGIPILAIPFFDQIDEQSMNCLLVQKAGVGEMIRSHQVSRKSVKERVEKLLNQWDEYSLKARVLFEANKLAGGMRAAADALEKTWLVKKYNLTKSRCIESTFGASSLAIFVPLTLITVLSAVPSPPIFFSLITVFSAWIILGKCRKVFC